MYMYVDRCMAPAIRKPLVLMTLSLSAVLRAWTHDHGLSRLRPSPLEYACTSTRRTSNTCSCNRRTWKLERMMATYTFTRPLSSEPPGPVIYYSGAWTWLTAEDMNIPTYLVSFKMGLSWRSAWYWADASDLRFSLGPGWYKMAGCLQAWVSEKLVLGVCSS